MDFESYHQAIEKLFTQGRVEANGNRWIRGDRFVFDTSKGLPFFGFYTYEKIDTYRALCECLWLLRGTSRVDVMKGLYTGMLEACIFDEKEVGEEGEEKTFKSTGLGDSMQMRRFGFHPIFCEMGFDQLRLITDFLSKKARSNCMIISFWNPHAFLSVETLPNTVYIQFFMDEGKLNLSVYCRQLTILYELPMFLQKWFYFLYIFCVAFGFEMGTLDVMPAMLTMIDKEYELWETCREEPFTYHYDPYPKMNFQFDLSKVDEPIDDKPPQPNDRVAKESFLYVTQFANLNLTNFEGVEDILVKHALDHTHEKE